MEKDPCGNTFGQTKFHRKFTSFIAWRLAFYVGRIGEPTQQTPPRDSEHLSL
jgi:hypothetical protein